jgi:hypothetical protein
VLAVETFAPTEKDLGINWVDWNPCPPDKDMGLWGAVDLVTTGEVTLRSPLAVTHFEGRDLKTGRSDRIRRVAQCHRSCGKGRGCRPLLQELALSRRSSWLLMKTGRLSFTRRVPATPHAQS